jgi:tetratricopeptide (TPR) repeat protein
MLNRALLAMTFLLAISCPVTLAGSAEKPQDIPAASREKLEDIFARVADKLWTQTDDAWHSHRLDVCIGLYRFIVEIDPKFVEAYDQGAWLIWSDGRDAEAKALYLRGIAANPDGYELLFDFGMFYYNKKDFRNAEAQFKAATSKSAPAMVWKMLAHSQEKQGNRRAALDTWRKVKELDPSDPAADRGIAQNQDTEPHTQQAEPDAPRP